MGDDPHALSVEPGATGEPNALALEELRSLTDRYGALLVDPPWRFKNRTGKIAPEYNTRFRYRSLSYEAITSVPVKELAATKSHLYLWVPNAMLREGLELMSHWGFDYKTNLVWHKLRKDGESHRGGVGFYFRNATELILFGVRGSLRTLEPGRTQLNLLMSRKRAHSRKPDELYRIIEECSPGPYIELFARYPKRGWTQWGDEHNSLPSE